MFSLIVRAQVPAAPAQVYEYVTTFPAEGQINRQALEQKYGRLLAQEGSTFTFLEDIGGGITWQCTFEPPSRRVMRAVDSTWSDRLDWFEPAAGGTSWAIAWELKASGIAGYIKWVFFHLWDKRSVRSRLIAPVLMHFHRQRLEQGRKGV